MVLRKVEPLHIVVNGFDKFHHKIRKLSDRRIHIICAIVYRGPDVSREALWAIPI